MRPIQIAPSVLPVDFSRLGEAICELDEAGVDLIQWDVMDGQFVPNLTFGPDVIASTRSLTKLPFEAHLMVLTPEVLASRYVEAGCSRLIVHVEACSHLQRTLGSGGVRGEERRPQARAEDHDTALLEVPDRAPRDVRLGDLTHRDRRLHPGLDALLLQEVLEREAVHHRPQHAHVVGAAAVHPALGELGAAKVVAAADDHGHLHARTHDVGGLPGDRVDDVGIDAE